MGASLSPKRSEVATNGLSATQGPSTNSHPVEAVSVNAVGDHGFEHKAGEVHGAGVNLHGDATNFSPAEHEPKVTDSQFVVASEAYVVDCGRKKDRMYSWGHAGSTSDGLEVADSCRTGDQNVEAAPLPLVDSALSAPVNDTAESVNYLREPSVSSNRNYNNGAARDELFATGLGDSESIGATGSLPVENLSLSDIMVGLYSGKETPMYRGISLDQEPIEDGLLPPLPNSEREGVRFESMLRSMGWQPLDDEDSTVITNLR
jgi:hypothetical protein